jgi:hypothetical protein
VHAIAAGEAKLAAEIMNAVATLRGPEAAAASYGLAANPPQALLTAYRNFVEASSPHVGAGALEERHAAIDVCRVAFLLSVDDALRAAGERARAGDGQH